MPAHQQFEELCALAVTGQITGDAMATLDWHLKECDQCRSFLQDVAPLKAHVAPVMAAAHVQDYEPPDGIRERFLQHAAAAGLVVEAGPALVTSEAGVGLVPGSPVSGHFVPGYGGWRRRYAPTFRYVAAAAACLVFGLGGYRLAQRGAPHPERAPIAVDQQGMGPHMTQLERDAAAARQKAEALSAELERAKVEKQRLVDELSVLAQRAAAGEQFEQQFKDEAQRLLAAEQRLQTLQAQLDDAQKRAETSDAVSLAQEHATEEAQDKLAALQTQLEREHEFSASKGDFSHLISARNLHIVDVYDAETGGGQGRPFGRVFYVEGKSLVFYAYDLPTGKHREANIIFRVWGETAGVKSRSYKLGILQNDDPKQNRWVLAFNDPKVLTRINAVYLTADATTSAGSEPRGRKRLYAFLGSPNHP